MSPDKRTNTAIALTPDDLQGVDYSDLDILKISEGMANVAEAARRLEIFLDRVCWKDISVHDRAAENLLDDRYLRSLSAEDRELAMHCCDSQRVRLPK